MWATGNDLALRVFLKAFQNLELFRGQCKFWTWRYSIARRVEVATGDGVVLRVKVSALCFVEYPRMIIRLSKACIHGLDRLFPSRTALSVLISREL